MRKAQAHSLIMYNHHRNNKKLTVQKSFWPKYLLLTLLSLTIQEAVAEGDKYNFLLAEAEVISRKDLDQFRQVLEELAIHRSQFSPEQACYHDFLELLSKSYDEPFADSILSVQQYLDICKDKNSLIRGKTLLANLRGLAGHYETAVIEIDEVLGLIKDVDDVALKSQIYWVASLVYLLVDQQELSLQYAEQLIKEAHSEDYTCLGAGNKFRALFRQGSNVNPNELHESIAICRASGINVVGLFLQLDWFRFVVLPMNNGADLSDAGSQLLSMEKEVDDTSYNSIQVYYAAVLAEYHLALRDYDAAEKFAKQVIGQADRIAHSEQLLMAFQVMVDLNLAKGVEVEAYRYLDEKTMFERENYDAKLEKQVAFFRVKHRNFAQEQQIEKLNQNNQMLELENRLAAETSKKQKLSVVLVSLLLLGLGWWTYRLKKQHDYFKNISEIDHLTQVFSRKAFEEQMPDMIKQCQSGRSQLHLAIFDLDHFKKINDQFGHLVGDWVLQQVVIACEEVIDEDVLMARLGGEEFVIVTPGITQAANLKLLEKMRLAIEQLDCSETGHEFKVTASFGVTSSLYSGLDLSVLLTHADVALFSAKDNGRNQISLFNG